MCVRVRARTHMHAVGSSRCSMAIPWAHQVLTVLDGRAWFHVGSSRSAIDVVWSSENRYDSHLTYGVLTVLGGTRA